MNRASDAALVIAPSGLDRLQGDVFGLGDEQQKTTAAARPEAEAGTDRTVGSALRSVYQQAVDEKIPDDLMDLLGKLS